MAGIPIVITREAWTPSAGGIALLINVPRGQALTIERIEGRGLLGAAAGPVKVGLYGIAAARNGSGGTPTTTGVVVAQTDLAVQLAQPGLTGLPAGISGAWAANQGNYTTPPTINSADLLGEMDIEGFGGYQYMPLQGRPFSFHNLQAGDMQIALAGLTGTIATANSAAFTLYGIVGV
jgi:hypothetical protein